VEQAIKLSKMKTQKRLDNLMMLNDNSLDRESFYLSNGTASQLIDNRWGVYSAAMSQENSRSIGGLFFLLVMTLHFWVALWLLKPIEVTTPAEPLIMEVAMVSAPGVKPSVAPPAPPKPIEPIKPNKPLEKKAVKKKTQEVHKQVKPPKPQIGDLFIPKPANIESFADASNAKNDASTQSSPTKSASGTKGNAEPYSEASFEANYGSNPKPVYPAIARRRGWEGKVLLKVDVSAEGLSQSVRLHQSSGYEELDDSAITAVEKWQFSPAKRGGESVPCTVIVPIIFTLNS